ncbi:MAG: aldehyde dehydrogenase family protein [Candidatus Omnitrophica bacterium]|nr:aldehyde dehydrogenase family protein [Candidatus Omnitrophota bacterium]
MDSYYYYVGGEFRCGKQKYEVINPANEDKFAFFFETDSEDLSYALEKAKLAQKEFSLFSFKERAKVLRDIANVIFDNVSKLAELETKQIGKPLKESLLVDIPLGADCFNYYASFVESLEENYVYTLTGIDLIKYEPFGVVGVYLPYNVPLMIFGFSCAPALAGGNALIVKPSEYGCLSILELAKYLDRLDIPKGLINIVSGRGDKIGKLIAQSDIELISFTGSRKTFEKITKEMVDYPKKTICELSGCNLSLVFSDADIEKALKNILASSFIKQGQMCIGTSLILVEEGIYDSFIKKLVDDTKRLNLSDPSLPETNMGPLPTLEHLRNIHSKVKEMKSKSGRILWGGEILNRKGYFYPPTVIEVNEIVYEEFFGPVVLVKSFKDRGEIEEIIQLNPTGLVLQIWTKDLIYAYKLSQLAKYGTIWINSFAQMDASTPFGGMKKSGWGRNLGKWGFFEYTQPKHIGIGLKDTPVSGWFGT